MSTRTLQQLEVKPGEFPSASKWNNLLLEIEARTVYSGPGVLVRRNPRGSIISATARARQGFSQWPFRLSLGENGITFNRGLINGVEPKIGGKSISGDTAGQPELVVSPGQLVYAICTLDPSGWGVNSVEIMAMDQRPATLPSFRAFKLMAIIDDDGTPLPTVFFNLGFYASSRSASTGRARYWFWAA